MKFVKLASIGLALAVAPSVGFGQGTPTKGDADLKTTEQKAAYGIGLDIGRKMKQQGLDIDPAILARGLRDGLTDKAALTEAQIQEALQAYRTTMMAKMAKVAAEAGDKNTKAGQAYLAANKTKPGVVTLPSGVQYKVLKAGKGASPKLTDTVTANYRGTLIDGTQFDASEPGNPTKFPVGGVIKGWTEVLQKMKVGDKWEVVIPSEMAYGERGSPPGIAPNSTLIFDIELVGVK